MVKLVGILNITPDSFSDGGLYLEAQAALQKTTQLFKDGASLVDAGAESTRPGAQPLTPQQEWQRLSQILQHLSERYPEQISVDTYHPETATRALELGDIIINDVTGMSNPVMVELVAQHKARCVISHLSAKNPQTAHSDKPVNDVLQVRDELLFKAQELQKKGLPKGHIILDPGIGFGKTEELNWKLLEFAKEVSDYPVMIGYSRKRFLGDKRMKLEANLEAGRTAIKAGAAYLRVHDVAGHRQLL